jgi:hypothetical protein
MKKLLLILSLGLSLFAKTTIEDYVVLATQELEVFGENIRVRYICLNNTVMIKYDIGVKGSLNQMFQEVDGKLHLVKCNELEDLIK